MEKIKSNWRGSGTAAEVETVLESHYSELLKWGTLLTRGDMGLAHDIVHDLCLHFTLVKPDLSKITNLEGYLYICLRNIYVSALARSSREAMQFVNVAEFDSIQSALAVASTESLLERQNDLRRICGYMVWRKESSKSASYFILHFFHGYGRREIAEIACLPISAIYNKLKIARAEVRSHLEDSGKLRIASRDIPPEADVLLSPVSSAELFHEIRETILRAPVSKCLPEEELLAHYRSTRANPISCALLSHLVSCASCLGLIDRHFQRPTFEDRGSPDGFGSSSEQDTAERIETHSISFKALKRAIEKQRKSVYEHRPRTLSIAVNGRITAFHDVQSEHSALSARIDPSEGARFVEVFTEQQVRLAMVPIEEHPPEGPHIYTQRVALSDDRWLQLTLSFDGLGLHSEVTYTDPALAAAMIEDEEEKENSGVAQGLMIDARKASIFAPILRYFQTITTFPVIAWTVALALFLLAGGYFAYRHAGPPLSAKEVLSRSVEVETANLIGNTEHQVLNVEAVSARGQVLQQGTIDLWRDGSGTRYIRQFYDARHRLLAAAWETKKGQRKSYSAKTSGDRTSSDTTLLTSDLWTQDVSSRAFSGFAGGKPQVRATDEGYELTVSGPIQGRPQLIAATLVLDRRLRPMRETMRVRNGAEIEEVRFVQVDYQRRLSASVPDSTFVPEDVNQPASNNRPPHSFQVQPSFMPDEEGRNRQLAQLHIAVLYQLNRLDADTADPIEVVRTSDGRIRVSGAVVDESRRVLIRSHLAALPNHQLLDLRLISSPNIPIQDHKSFQILSGSTKVYEADSAKPLADAQVRRYFQAKGFSGAQLDAAVFQFSSGILETAQHALQSAYALDRLGRALSPAELDSVGPASQGQWSEMVERHASDLEGQLRSLNDQLSEVSLHAAGEKNSDGDVIRIDDPAQFSRVAHNLLLQVQKLDQDVNTAFSSRSPEGGQGEIEPMPAVMISAIPSREGQEMENFASQLAISGRVVTARRQESSR